MKINSENKQAIHDVLITDIQKRLYEDGLWFSSFRESLIEDILHTNSIVDINNVLCNYDKLFPSEYLTLDGTWNYIIYLLVGGIYELTV